MLIYEFMYIYWPWPGAVPVEDGAAPAALEAALRRALSGRQGQTVALLGTDPRAARHPGTKICEDMPGTLLEHRIVLVKSDKSM